MIPFNDFDQQYKDLKPQLNGAILRVLESGWFVMGQEVSGFEREFADYLGSTYCVGVASGTDAITLSLMALGIGPGDEVITTSVTAFPTITGIMRSGATPVVIDIFEDDGLMNPRMIRQKINKNTKAIVPVHLYGQSCDMDAITKVAADSGLKVMEDCAQSAGAEYKGKKCGAMGICGAFSFYPTKNLGAYGDAGAIVTNDHDLYEKLLIFRNYGQTKRYYHDFVGLNSRLDEIQAALLREKLPYLDEWNRKRNHIARYYREHLEEVGFLTVHAYGKPVDHLFIIKVLDRDGLLNYLSENGIGSLIHYPRPIHRQKAYSFQPGEVLQHAENFTKKILSLPIYPEMKGETLDKIVETINNYGK